MAEVPKLLYIVVLDDYDQNKESRDGNQNSCSVVNSSFSYTRPVLQSCLQLMGCKARHAFKISRRVFELIKSANLRGLFPEVSSWPPVSYIDEVNDGSLEHRGSVAAENGIERSNSVQFELYKRLTTTIVPRATFLDVVCDALSQYKYVGPNQRADLILACRTRERKESVTVLLCGTSGCGKSTLSSLLGSRLGVTTVVSTDSIRHMMRSFVDEKQNPLLWASTYHAGECLDPMAVADAKAKRKAKKMASVSSSVIKDEITDEASNKKIVAKVADAGPILGLISEKQMAVEGFKAQSEMVIDSLDRLITAWEHRKESVVVEGVHLSLNFVMNLMKKHPSIIPFMIYITNEEKHMERFAVRAKYMTLDPAKNKYVKYIRNIRTIQEYLCNQADKHLVPKVNNTNVDRSVAVIHATVFSCLRRQEAGEQLYDPITNTVPIIDEEYRNQCVAKSSKGMFQVIQRKGSSRHLMALLNTDGSVAKAWPVNSVENNASKSANGRGKCLGSPLYGPQQIGKAEPVNLQFGSFGISAWPSDTGSTSHTGSVDESRADGTDMGSRYFSSCCSSPWMSEGASKELKENISVSGSEEEADPHDLSSDDDLADVDKKEIHDEMEGSVDEESTKTDEEYEDLAMQDGLENGYSSDDDEPYKENKQKQQNTPADYLVKYRQNMDHFLRTSQCPLEPPCPYSSSMTGRNTRVADGGIKKRSLSDSSRFYEHHHSMNNVTALGEQGSTTMYSGPILSGAL